MYLSHYHKAIVLGALGVICSLTGQWQNQSNNQTKVKMETKQMTNPMEPGTHNPGRVYFVTFIYYAEDGEARFKEFMNKAAPLW